MIARLSPNIDVFAGTDLTNASAARQPDIQIVAPGFRQARSNASPLHQQADMNLREVNRSVAVDQHVHGIADMRAIDLGDADPVRAKLATHAAIDGIYLQHCRPARAFDRAYQRRITDLPAVGLRGQRGEVEGVALGEAVVCDMRERR